MSNEMWEQTADFRIEIRLDKVHAFCKKCEKTEQRADWIYKGLDPALPQIELKCTKCGNRQTYKLYPISHGFPPSPVSSNPSVM